jgi:hypothetical protein
MGTVRFLRGLLSQEAAQAPGAPARPTSSPELPEGGGDDPRNLVALCVPCHDAAEVEAERGAPMVTQLRGHGLER